MAILNQSSTSKTFYFGWYGSCAQDPCVDFDLDSFADKDKIYSVFQYDIFNVGNNIFNPNLPANFNQFNSLECGKLYQITLNSGDGSIDIPNFETTNFGTLDAGRVTQNCNGTSTVQTYELIESNQYGNLVNETPNEFNNLVIKLKTGDVTAGTVVPFTISGSNITLEDFVGLSSLQGTFTVGDDGSDGNFLLSRLDLQIAADSTTEGPETFRIALDDHQAVFLDITIQDTSQSPPTEISIYGYGMSNISGGTHEGVNLKIYPELNKSGTCSWSINGNVSSSDFSYIEINNQNISSQDLSNLSGTFTSVANVENAFYLMTIDDSTSESPYEDLTLTVTYDADGTSATSDTFKIYDMPSSYASLTHDLPVNQDWNNGDSVIFELTYNISAQNEVSDFNGRIPFRLTGTGNGSKVLLSDITIEGSNNDGIFSIDTSQTVESNGDISGWFRTNKYSNYGNDNVKSYVKITINPNSDMNGKQMRFELPNPPSGITTPIEFDFVFPTTQTQTYALTGVIDFETYIITLDTTNVADSTDVAYTLTGQDNAGNLVEQSWFDSNSDLISGNFVVVGNTATIQFTKTGPSRNITDLVVTLDNITPTVSTGDFSEWTEL